MPHSNLKHSLIWRADFLVESNPSSPSFVVFTSVLSCRLKCKLSGRGKARVREESRQQTLKRKITHSWSSDAISCGAGYYLAIVLLQPTTTNCNACTLRTAVIIITCMFAFFIQFTALTSCDQSAVYVNAHLRCNPKPEHFQCHAFQLLHIILRGLAHIFSAIKQFCSNIVSAKALLPVKGKLTWAISGLPADALINWAYSETSFLFYIAAAHVGKKVLIVGT